MGGGKGLGRLSLSASSSSQLTGLPWVWSVEPKVSHASVKVAGAWVQPGLAGQALCWSSSTDTLSAVVTRSHSLTGRPEAYVMTRGMTSTAPTTPLLKRGGAPPGAQAVRKPEE